MKKNKKNTNFQTKNVILISFAHLIHDTYSAFFAPVLPLLIGKLGISLFQAGLLDIIRKIPSLFNPFVGILADRIYVRYFIVAAPVITTISMSLIGLSPNYIFLMVLVFVSGVASTLFHVPSPVLIRSFSAGQVGRGMSYYMLGGEFARSLGPLVILGAVSLWGLEGTWKLIPFGLAASLILHIRLRNISVVRTSEFTDLKGKKETLIQLIPFFISVSGFLFFQASVKIALTVFLPVYLTNKGYSLWLAGISLALLQFSGATGTFFAGSLSDRIGREKILLIVAVVNPLFMWLLVGLKGFFVIPVLIISGFFLFASGPVLLAMVYDIRTKHSSLVNGVYMTLSFIAVSLMTLFLGLSSDKFGMDMTYKMASLVSLGCIPFVFMMWGNKKRASKLSYLSSDN